MILCGDDLAYALTGLKGWVFLVPFFLFWLWILDKLQQGAAVWLQKPAGFALSAWILNPDLALSLFKSHPPTLSAYYLIALYTLPVFALLGSCNQLAGDAGSGYFRFLLSRCTRDEIWVARLLSAYLLIAAGSMIVGLAAAIVTLQTDNRPVTEVIGYAVQINWTLLLYLLAWVALIALLSATLSSAAACLLSAPMLFFVVKTTTFVLQLQWPQLDVLAYVLPGKLTGLLVDPDASVALWALLALPLYVLAYGALAIYRFRRRDL